MTTVTAVKRALEETADQLENGKLGEVRIKSVVRLIAADPTAVTILANRLSDRGEAGNQAAQDNLEDLGFILRRLKRDGDLNASAVEWAIDQLTPPEVYIQQMGRALRPNPGPAVILDYDDGSQGLVIPEMTWRGTVLSKLTMPQLEQAIEQTKLSPTAHRALCAELMRRDDAATQVGNERKPYVPVPFSVAELLGSPEPIDAAEWDRRHMASLTDEQLDELEAEAVKVKAEAALRLMKQEQARREAL